MESVRPLDEHRTFEWEYDAGAHFLYLSQDEPREAIGVDKHPLELLPPPTGRSDARTIPALSPRRTRRAPVGKRDP